MLRSILAAVVFSLVCGTIPALAARSCEDWCQNRCAHQSRCIYEQMSPCVSAKTRTEPAKPRSEISAKLFSTEAARSPTRAAGSVERSRQKVN
jgi:hypothetical protein